MSTTKTEDLSRFYDILKDFDTAMFVTRTPDGQLRSRPMALAEVEEGEDLWFVTDIGAPKVDEIESYEQVNISLQQDNTFLSISGRADIVRDREQIDELWSAAWRAYFPEGKDDDRIALLRVTPQDGEFWDYEGTERLKFAFKAVKSAIQGEREDFGDEDGHGRVNLH